MRVPQLSWNRRHNVAVVTVSFCGRLWDAQHHADLIIGYSAVGRLARVVFLNPRAQLPAGCTEEQALQRAIELLSSTDARPEDLAVLRSALRRAAR